MAIAPVLIFVPMFKFIMVVGVTSDNQLLSLLGGMVDVNALIASITGIDLEHLPEKYTIRQVYDMFFGENAVINASGFDFSAFPSSLKGFFTASAVLFAVSLVLAVTAFILGLFVKEKLIVSAASGLGLITCLSSRLCFNHIASKLVSGEMSISGILSNIPALSEYKTYLEYINFDIRTFELSTAFTLILIILLLVTVLGVIYHLADSVKDV